jgi:regulator of replication initiation timing
MMSTTYREVMMPSVYENNEMRESFIALTDTITRLRLELRKARSDIGRLQKLNNDLEYENEQLRKYIISLEMNNSIAFNKD